MSSNAIPAGYRRIGGYFLSGIVGVNRYLTPLDVYLQVRGEVPAPKETFQMVLGRALEPVVASLYSQREGFALAKAPFVEHPSKPYLVVAPDYVTASNPKYLVEVKTHGGHVRDQYGPAGSGLVPDHIYVQVQWQLYLVRKMIPDLSDECRLVALFGGTDLDVWHIPYNREVAEWLEDEATRFWEHHVMRGVPPEPAGDCRDTLRRLYPQSTDRVIRADERLEQVVYDLRQAYLDVAKAEARLAELQSIVQYHMQDASVLETSIGKITWRRTKDSVREVVDAEGLKRDLPDVASKYVSTRTVEGVRRFVIPTTWRKEIEGE